MDIFEVKNALEKICVLVDTREQDTMAFRERVKNIGFPYKRQKLDFGDYSAKVVAESETIDFSDDFAIERKMSLDELCNCYCNGRKRFEREFLRAKEKNAKLYLLIENADFDKVFNGEYRSLMQPQALIASIIAWLARYNCQLLFCSAKLSGNIIKEIIYREVKERLESNVK